jgi:hypothetical protein
MLEYIFIFIQTNRVQPGALFVGIQTAGPFNMNILYCAFLISPCFLAAYCLITITNRKSLSKTRPIRNSDSRGWDRNTDDDNLPALQIQSSLWRQDSIKDQDLSTEVNQARDVPYDLSRGEFYPTAPSNGQGNR